MDKSRLEMVFDPSPEILAAVEKLTDGNPFQTANYSAARRSQGMVPWAIQIWQGEHLMNAFLAFSKSGRLRKSLEIPSFPGTTTDGTQWCSALEDTLSRSGFTNLLVSSFASPPGLQIPSFHRELARYPRREFVIDLPTADLPDGLASNHRRNYRRAAKAGLECTSDRSEATNLSHVELMATSLQRRQKRGEQISVGTDLTNCRALVEHGAAEVYQARDGAETLSSMLVLKAAGGAYYHSAGTTPKGMKIGASHFLIAQVAQRFQAAGLKVFNLGGAEESQSGLARFKSGFGARQIKLEAVRALVGQGPRSWLILAVHRLAQARQLPGW